MLLSKVSQITQLNHGENERHYLSSPLSLVPYSPWRGRHTLGTFLGGTRNALVIETR